MKSTMEKAEFYLDADPETTFSGYTKGDTWNGWACPYFEKEVAEQIAEHHGEIHRYENAEEYWAEYDPDEDVFRFHDDQGEEPRTFGPVETEKGKLYAIGAYCWTWVEVED
jgi:hypothetical protein